MKNYFISGLLHLKKRAKNICNFSGLHSKDASVKIRSFKRYISETKDVCDFSIDGAMFPDFEKKPFSFSGWIVGKNVRFNSIEIFSNGSNILSIPVKIKRPDVAKHLKLSTENDEFGFGAYFNPFFLPCEFKLEGFAVSPQLGRVKIFTMTGKRKQLHKELSFEIRPLLITTLGRTGSTYLLGFLGAHPNITVYRPFQVEARYASYWAQMFLNFSHPKSWLYPLASYDLQDPAWILGNDDGRLLHHALYPGMSDWFEASYIENLYRLCIQSLQGHYLKVSQIQNKPEAKFFGEKFLPNFFTDAVMNLMPEAKEIILSRDFRDMFCSIKAFNKKRGFMAFGREKFNSDKEYISKALFDGARSLLQTWERRKSESLLVRYEDLICEPEVQLSRIYEYLEIDSSPKLIRKVIEKAGKTQPKSQKQHKTTNSTQDSLQRFRRELDPELLKLCNRVFEKPLKHFGYVL